MTDLDALKQDLAALRERGDLAAALTATTAELHRLIEEVERLRKQLPWAEAQGIAKERMAVVAFLRAGLRLHYADCIERGEHRAREQEGR